MSERLEKEYQRWLRKLWSDAGMWSTSVEYAVGGDDGCADMFLKVDPVGLVPCEMKIGSVVGDRLKLKNVRPSQTGWHRDYRDHGGRSFFLVGVQRTSMKLKTSWDTYIIPSCEINSGEPAYLAWNIAFISAPNNISESNYAKNLSEILLMCCTK